MWVLHQESPPSSLTKSLSLTSYELARPTDPTVCEVKTTWSAQRTSYGVRWPGSQSKTSGRLRKERPATPSSLLSTTSALPSAPIVLSSDTACLVLGAAQ